ncbi:MAG TPA: class I SAM-dependent rRNA methyltransferase, partial [Ilumatobacteraceae bacterium]|nr:class I SAM-dependent rRNA methyltransferase [Ilumatobacteraceae bacterium]
QRLTRLAVGLLDDDGVLVQSSCSSRVGADDFFAAVHAAAAGSGVRLVDIVRTGHALDHPTTFAQSAYLKTLFARVHR